ncbi:hypothetical protein [Pedobacter sp.]|uniref:hypothetical protein n=1 Tax=Pedobacter sp. TaxID=1411316 RepID=UPI003C5AF802
MAERYQYEDWVTMVAGRTPGGAAMGRIIKDLCELMCNEAVKAEGEECKQQLNELSMRLSDVFRLLIRYQNIHPEIFSDLDKTRVDKARETMQKYAPPFDPKQVLRKSESFPEP